MPGTSQAALLARYAKAHDVSYGFAGYWDAGDLTWATNFKVQIYPVYECTATNNGLCESPVVHVTSWYVVRPGTRSMLIVNADEPPPAVTGVDPAFGPPIASTTIGDLSVYVFNYDIAAKLSYY